MDDLKKSLRELTKQLENELEELENVRSSIDPDLIEITYDLKYPEEELHISIGNILGKLKDQALQLNKMSTTTTDISLSNHYLSDLKISTKRFQNLTKIIEEKRWQIKLLGNSSRDTQDDTHLSVLFRESKSLDNTIEMGSSVLATTQEVSKSLAYQKEKLQSSQDKVVRFAETIPGINLLLGRISRRKRFNAIVIGAAISICVCVTLIYVL